MTQAAVIYRRVCSVRQEGRASRVRINHGWGAGFGAAYEGEQS